MNGEDILCKLTLKEKIALCSGRDYWHTKDLSAYGLPSMMMSDGPHGLRCQKSGTDMLGMNRSEPATCFPTAALTACSWDRELLGEIGKAEMILDRLLAEGACVSLKQLAVDGRDLTALGLRGPAVGQVLCALLDAVVDGDLANDRTALLERAQTLLPNRC